MPDYKVLMHKDAFKKADTYLGKLRAGDRPGEYLSAQLQTKNLASMQTDEFIELLMRTKSPQIFAESAVSGDGKDWNLTELSILGDISVVTPVMVFDNGLHSQPVVHKQPFEATLLFTPGALLRNGRNQTPSDWTEVTRDQQINFAGYYKLYERRLLPVFLYANTISREKGKDALITIPGLGCGMFAGPFKGQLEFALEKVLREFLETHGKAFSNIKVVYYDPFSVCNNSRIQIHGINFLVRPLTQGNSQKPQLCKPEGYAESGDFFAYHELFSIVAWDHVSWPGNDFYGGSRATDDGVKAAATSSMAVMTGIAGAYDSRRFQYCPPHGYSTWAEVIDRCKLQLEVWKNLIVLS